MDIPTKWVIAGPRLTDSSASLKCCSKHRQEDKLDVEDMQRLQTDVLSLPALQLIELLRAAMACKRTPTPPRNFCCVGTAEVERDSAAAALYEVWLQIVTRKTMDLRDAARRCGR